MKIADRFKRLTVWNRLGAIGALCSILAFVGWLLWPKGSGDISVRVEVKDSPQANVQTAVNSPGATQIRADTFVLKVVPQLERKLSMKPVHLNKPVGDKFESLFEGKLEAPYPVPMLYVQAHGTTVEKVDLRPILSGPHCLRTFHGKRDGYLLTGLANAIGRLRLKVITGEAEKLELRFSVDG